MEYKEYLHVISDVVEKALGLGYIRTVNGVRIILNSLDRLEEGKYEDYELFREDLSNIRVVADSIQEGGKFTLEESKSVMDSFYGLIEWADNNIVNSTVVTIGQEFTPIFEEEEKKNIKKTKKK